MHISKVLSSIVHGNTNFCCLCLEAVEDSAVWPEDEVFITAQDTQTMAELICSFFDEDVQTAAFVFGVYCSKCKDSIVESYKFKRRCSENVQQVISVVNSVTESFENVLSVLENFKTLYVSIDLNDYATKQFYDESSFENTCKEFKRNYSVVNTSLQANTIKPEPVKNTYNITENSLSGLPKPRNRLINKYDLDWIETSTLVINPESTTNYTCKVCLKEFNHEYMLRLHFFKKHYPRNYKCPTCSRLFLTEEWLKDHSDSFHGGGVCRECGKHFKNKYGLRKHEMNHNLQITCGDCGRTYLSHEAFKKHKTDDVCGQKSKKTADQATLECDYCKKRYCYKPYLAKHIMHEHGDAVGFKCMYCSKRYYTQSRLKTHMVKHTGEKNFVCNICEGRFVTRESLLYHTRLHTGEKPYQCEYCDKSFLSASRRLDHTRRHHLAPSLECDICHVKFKATSSLRRHRNRHFNPLSRLSVKENRININFNYTSSDISSFNPNSTLNVQLQ